jgi:L-ribulose-5-phosphate 3-epimerase
LKIGVIVDSFRLGVKDGLRKAKEVGAAGVQMYAVSGEIAPENMSAKARKELRNYVADLGLEISAICGDLGGHGFAREADNPKKIERSKRIMDLAVELGTNVVTTHVGVIPDNENDATWQVLHLACSELAEYANSIGAHFAIETGPEKATTLKKFLDAIPGKGIAVNLDPANLVMVTGDDPVKAVYTLQDYIVHTHAKDGIMKKQTEPRVIYHHFAEGGIEDLRLEDYFLETPLGEGQVDFPAYLKALSETGFTGYLTIEREVGSNPEADIRKAVGFLQEQLKA